MIPIVYCGSNPVFKGILMPAVSMAKRTKEDLEILIVTMDCKMFKDSYIQVKDENIQLLEREIKKYNENNHVIKLDVSDKFINKFLGGKNTRGSGFSPYCLLRLLLDDEIFSSYEKIIYLDIDTMLNDDIKKLYDVDVTDYDFAMAKDELGSVWISRNYCNSGVMVFNLVECRKNNTLEKAREKVNKHFYFMPDQTALQRATKKKLIMDGKFNSQKKIREDTVVMHFNRLVVFFPFPHFRKIKQWDIDKVHSKMHIYNFDEDYNYFKSIENEIVN